MCLRRLEKWEEAGNLYIKTVRFIRYSERIAMINSLFGVILLPMMQDRRMIADELETLRDSLIEYGDIRKKVKRPLFNTFYEKYNKKWVHHKEAAKELHTRSFF